MRELRVRIPLRSWIFISCVFVGSVCSGLCGELLALSEESCWVCVCVCVSESVCDL